MMTNKARCKKLEEELYVLSQKIFNVKFELSLIRKEMGKVEANDE